MGRLPYTTDCDAGAGCRLQAAGYCQAGGSPEGSHSVLRQQELDIRDALGATRVPGQQQQQQQHNMHKHTQACKAGDSMHV